MNKLKFDDVLTHLAHKYLNLPESYKIILLDDMELES